MTTPFDISIAALTLLDDIERDMSIGTLDSSDEKIIERLDDDACTLISKLLKSSNEQLILANKRADASYERRQALTDIIDRIIEITEAPS